MLQALIPLAVVDFSIVPGVYTLTVSLAILEEAEVRVVIRVALESTTVPHVLLPLSLVLTTVPIAHHTFAISFPVLHLTHIKGVTIALLKVVRQFLKCLEVKLWILKHYFVEVGKISGLGILGCASAADRIISLHPTKRMISLHWIISLLSTLWPLSYGRFTFCRIECAAMPRQLVMRNIRLLLTFIMITWLRFTVLKKPAFPAAASHSPRAWR